MSAIDNTLSERGQRYGEFTGHAEVTQHLKRAMGRHPGWLKLKDDQREALEMTAHKIGRILNGDPNYIDSWHDIIGYVRLVEQRLEREQTPGTQSAQKSLDFGAMMRDVLDGLTTDEKIDGKVGSAAQKPVPAQDKSPEETAPRKYTWAEMVEKLGLKEADKCACPACALEDEIKALFPDAEVKVVFLGEETGRTD